MRFVSLYFLTFLLAVGIGCSGSTSTAPERAQKGSKDLILEKYESSFRPSDYDPDITPIMKADIDYKEAPKISDLSVPVQPETLQGFRIQVILTQDIEQASRTRDDITKSFGDNAVYIVYDLPYYKVRVGNFAEREEAGESMKKLTGMGYKDVWIVPDKIIRGSLHSTAPSDSVQRRQ
jgi:hypothetical protein